MRKPSWRALARAGAAAWVGALACSATALAADEKTWVGGASTGNWGSTTNWSPSGFLTSALDTAVFNGSGVSTVNSFLGGGSRAGTDLKFNDNADGAVTIGFADSNGTTARSLRLVGNIDVSSGAAGSFWLSGPGLFYWGVFENAAGDFSHSILNNSTTGGTLNINVIQTFGPTTNVTSSTLTYGGVGAINLGGGIQVAEPTLRTVNVVKTGSNVVTNTGTSSYTGTTSINGGAWLVNGTHNSAGNYTVASGATLGGSGAINLASADTAVTVNGTLAPGSAAGAIGAFNFGVGDLVLAGAVDLQIDLSTGTFDKLIVGDELTYGGVLNVTFTGTDSDGAILDVFDFVSQTGGFSQVNYSGLDSSMTASFDATSGVVSVVVPEPATASVFVLAAATGLLRRRGRTA